MKLWPHCLVGGELYKLDMYSTNSVAPSIRKCEKVTFLVSSDSTILQHQIKQEKKIKNLCAMQIACHILHRKTQCTQRV